LSLGFGSNSFSPVSTGRSFSIQAPNTLCTLMSVLGIIPARDVCSSRIPHRQMARMSDPATRMTQARVGHTNSAVDKQFLGQRRIFVEPLAQLQSSEMKNRFFACRKLLMACEWPAKVRNALNYFCNVWHNQLKTIYQLLVYN